MAPEVTEEVHFDYISAPYPSQSNIDGVSTGSISTGVQCKNVFINVKREKQRWETMGGEKRRAKDNKHTPVLGHENLPFPPTRMFLP